MYIFLMSEDKAISCDKSFQGDYSQKAHGFWGSLENGIIFYNKML